MKLTGNTFRITPGDCGPHPAAGSNTKPKLRVHARIRPGILKYASVTGFLSATVVASQIHAQEIDGERLYRQRCASCHSLEAGQNRAGPSLAGVNGRTAGSTDGARYSLALRNSNVVWNAEALDRFLANPRQFVPGTTMSVSVTNEAQRRALVDFLTAR